MSGSVMVILQGGGLGESVMGATHAEEGASSRECPGNNEQQCPSGPMPSNNTSNTPDGTTRRNSAS